MEGIPTYVIALGFGFPFYVPAMIVGAIVGFLVKSPGRGFFASFVTTQVLASLAWIVIGNFPELTVYFLLPSFLTGIFVLLVTVTRRSKPPRTQ